MNPRGNKPDFSNVGIAFRLAIGHPLIGRPEPEFCSATTNTTPMNLSCRFKQMLTAVCMTLFGCVARADTVTYHFTDATSRTLRSLGTSFVVGCAMLATGIVIAAVISRRK